MEAVDSTRLWQRTLVSVIRISSRRLDAMSRPRALRLGTGLGVLGFHLARRPRIFAERNLRLVLGETLSDTERAALVRRVFIHFGKTTMDFLKAPSYDRETLNRLITRVDGWDEYAAPAFAAGRGLVAATGHVGNWEIFCRWVAAQGLPLTVVARAPEDGAFGDHVRRMRESAGYTMLHRGDSVRPLIAALKRGEAIGLMVDQNSGDTFVPFYGVPAGTTIGPALIALRTGASLLPAQCLMLPDDTYRIVYGAPIPTVSTGDKDADAARIMTAVNAALETVVREYPEQWLWVHNRWKSAFEEKNRHRWPSGYSFETLSARWHAAS
jgi:KDO2-lipid IV(A) lauroyltransferase